MLEAAGDLAAPRAAEGALDAAHHAEGDARAAVGGAADREHDVARLGGLVGPGQRRCARGVDLEHDEVAVGVDRRHLALHGPAVGEGDLGGAVAQVVGVGEDVPVGDDDPAPAARGPADAHDGRGGGGEGGAGRLAEGGGLGGGHGRGSSR